MNATLKKKNIWKLLQKCRGFAFHFKIIQYCVSLFQKNPRMTIENMLNIVWRLSQTLLNFWTWYKASCKEATSLSSSMYFLFISVFGFGRVLLFTLKMHYGTWCCGSCPGHNQRESAHQPLCVPCSLIISMRICF